MVVGSNRSNEDKLMAALRHPLRRSILMLMDEEEAISPRELAPRLGRPLSNVAYHVRVLADCAAVTLVSTTAVRGATQHFYATAVEAPWARTILGLGSWEERLKGETSKNPST